MRIRISLFAKKTWTLLALGIGMAAVSAPAMAQYLDGPAYAFPVTDMIGPAIAGRSMDSYIDKSRRPGTPPARPRNGPGRPATVADLRVGGDPAISRKVKADFRAGLLRSHPDQQAAIDQALSRDWLAGYRAEIAAPNQLDARNLADAVTGYMVAAWAIVHKQQQISPRAIASVRDHFRATMAASPQTAGLSAGARQQMAEELAYQTVLIMANRTHIARTGDARLADAAARHYRATVRTGARVDLQALLLQDDGFVSR